MALYFLDSNIIIKYYYTEPGSTWVRSIVDNKVNGCFISEIAFPEVAAALSQLHDHKRFGRRFLHNTFQRFEEEVAKGPVCQSTANDRNALSCGTVSAELFN